MDESGSREARDCSNEKIVKATFVSTSTPRSCIDVISKIVILYLMAVLRFTVSVAYS